MSQAKIKNLLSYELQSSAIALNTRIAYDNLALSPEAAPNETHLQTHQIPIPVYDDSLGGDVIVYSGIYQIKILIGAGRATKEADDIADALFRLYRVNRIITNTATGFKTQIVTPMSVGEGKRVDGWWVVPCWFEYRTYTN